MALTSEERNTRREMVEDVLEIADDLRGLDEHDDAPGACEDIADKMSLLLTEIEDFGQYYGLDRAPTDDDCQGCGPA